jgi:glucosamine-6-phosphate deaminase
MERRVFRVGQLNVRVFENREAMGAAAAAEAVDAIREILSRAQTAGVIFAAAPSQNELLAGLRTSAEVDWPRVEAFHMDEYLGLSGDHPASFRRFLRERLMDHVPVGRFHGIAGDAADPEAECARYAALLANARPNMALMGIGENGHLAFNDPPVCEFSDPRDARIVDLEEVCRMQQVHDGAFQALEDVPERAVTLTIPVFMRTPRVLVVVPGESKRQAVKAALDGPISEACPASILRRHPNATLFLDADSAPQSLGRA